MAVSREAIAVQAFLATPAALEVLKVNPALVLQVGLVLKADGVLLATKAQDLHAETIAWLLGLAAEHGVKWRAIAMARIRQAGPDRPDRLAASRRLASELAQAGDPSRAIEAIVAGLKAYPGAPLTKAAEDLVRATGRLAMKEGPSALCEWIEVFR